MTYRSAAAVLALLGGLACGDDPGPVTTCLSHPIDGNAYPSSFDLEEVNELHADLVANLPGYGERLGVPEVTTCEHALAVVDAAGYDACTCE